VRAARPFVRWLRAVLRTLGHAISVIEVGCSYIVDGPHGVERLLLRKDRHQERFLLHLLGAKMGTGCVLEGSLEIHNSGAGFNQLTIGQDVHIGKSVFIDLAHPVVIEPRVTISMRCVILTHLDVGASPLRGMGFEQREAGVTIAEGAYLGAGVIVLPGVKIGSCAVVGAGAVVNRDVAARSVYAGVPARLVRKLG
jgi:acetyltransferase-like isoleucine patch superfamily enzyme